MHGVADLELPVLKCVRPVGPHALQLSRGRAPRLRVPPAGVFSREEASYAKVLHGLCDARAVETGGLAVFAVDQMRLVAAGGCHQA